MFQECLDETDGHFDGSFPFVVKYDKYTSGYFTRNNKNIQSDDNMNVPRNSPQKNDRKSDFNDSIRPSSSELNANRMNESTDMGNKNKKKSKRSRKRKKRSGEEMLKEEEKASKRRKVEGDKVVSKDHEGDQGQLRNQKLHYAEDNCDQMETFTSMNFNHSHYYLDQHFDHHHQQHYHYLEYHLDHLDHYHHLDYCLDHYHHYLDYYLDHYQQHYHPDYHLRLDCYHHLNYDHHYHHRHHDHRDYDVDRHHQQQHHHHRLD